MSAKLPSLYNQHWVNSHQLSFPFGRCDVVKGRAIKNTWCVLPKAGQEGRGGLSCFGVDSTCVLEP